MIYGYARISVDEQTTDPQLIALERAGCDHIYQDHGVPGAGRRRPGLNAALAAIGPGEILTVWRLDRLGRNLSDLLTIIQEIEAKGAAFRSLTEHIDTTTAAGRLFFHLAGVFAEFEREVIAERTRAGIRTAVNKGVKLGRRVKLTPLQVKHARMLIEAGERPLHVARALKVSDSTLYRAFQRYPDDANH